MTLISKYDIYKIGKGIFQIGNISSDNNLIKNIISILELGNKFVPSIHNNLIDIHSNTIKQFDKNLLDLNAKLFYQRKKFLISNEFNKNDQLNNKSNFELSIKKLMN